MTETNSKKRKDRDYSIKYIKTKKVPIVISLKRKDGTISKLKANKIIRDTSNVQETSL